MRGMQYFSVFVTMWNAASLALLLMQNSGMGRSNVLVFISIIYAGGTVGFFLLCYLGGLFDEVYGIWKNENDYSYDVTPRSKEMYENSQLMVKEIKALRKEVEALKNPKERRQP